MKKLPQLIVSLGFVFVSINCFADSGTLIIAHGGMKGCEMKIPVRWETQVHQMVENIKKTVPNDIELAFGMWNTKCFQLGIERLKESMLKKGRVLTHLKVLPLFISSHSAVIEMQKYIFGKRNDQVIPNLNVAQINFQGSMEYLNALDYNPQISLILAKNLRQLIDDANQRGLIVNEMEVFLVMHGPVGEENNIKWLEMGQRYLEDLLYLFPSLTGYVISLRDDAPQLIKSQATLVFRNQVELANKNGRAALILPLLLSSGGIEVGILERLERLPFTWTGQALLPDPYFEKVLRARLLL